MIIWLQKAFHVLGGILAMIGLFQLIWGLFSYVVLDRWAWIPADYLMFMLLIAIIARTFARET